MNPKLASDASQAGQPPAFPLVAGSVSYALFEHMSREHGLTLIGSELDEIVRVVNSALEERLRWWIANAEQVAKERGELFRAGEEIANELRRPRERRCVVLPPWDAAAQPMRDMIAAISQNTQICRDCGANNHE